MYQIYACEGLVLSKRGVGEANILISILTRDLGLVRATARSARVEQSKLRYGLEVLTRARFSFVRGKHEWKLVGVEHVLPRSRQGTVASMQTAGRITKLLLRLVQGEDVAPTLFDSVIDGLEALMRTHTVSVVQSIESILVLKILYHLGYLPHTSELKVFIEGDFFALELAEEAERSRALLVRTINESLQATGL